VNPPAKPADPRIKKLAYALLAAGLLVMTFGFATTGAAKESPSTPKATPVAAAAAKETPVALTSVPDASAAPNPAPEGTMTPEQAVVAPPGSNGPIPPVPNAAPSATPATPTPPVATPTPRVTPTPRATPSAAVAAAGTSSAPIATAQLEQDLLAAHNAARAAANVPPMQMDPKLVTIARARAQDMATRSYFSHTSPGGDTAFSLLGQAAYAYTIAAENIARNNYPDAQSVGVSMDGFLNSPSHKENIVDARFKNVGIGVATAADGMKYIAVIFAG
jgi:uncharacterized protein YkwD